MESLRIITKAEVPSGPAIMFNFICMALSFSINHGTVTAMIAIASTSLPIELAGIQTGVLYVMYTLSALTVAAGMVQWTGAKWALVWALGLYCFYVGSFLMASMVPPSTWYAAIIGATIGGFAAGWLWTAQGAYFSRSAEIYAKSMGIEKEKAVTLFAAIFSTIYVGFEVICKGLTSLLNNWGGNDLIFGVMLSCAVISTVAMFFVRSPPAEIPDALDPDSQPLLSAQPVNTPTNIETPELTWKLSFYKWRSNAGKKIKLASNLFVRSRKLQYLSFLNFSFGLTGAFLQLIVNSDILTAAVGKENIGYVNAISPAVATLMSFPYSWLCNRIGRMPLMIFGALNFFLVSVFVGSFPMDVLQSMGWGICFLYILQGSGRAIFESTSKATFADFFPNDKEAAFANIIIQSGGASALAFFIYPHMSIVSISAVAGSVSCLAMFAMYMAFRQHKMDTQRFAFLAASVE